MGISADLYLEIKSNAIETDAMVSPLAQLWTGVNRMKHASCFSIRTIEAILIGIKISTLRLSLGASDLENFANAHQPSEIQE